MSSLSCVSIQDTSGSSIGDEYLEKPEVGTSTLPTLGREHLEPYLHTKGPTAKTRFKESPLKIDGVLEAGHFTYIFPINILQADFDMDVQTGHLHVAINDDGGLTGIFSGAAGAEEMLYEWEQTEAPDKVAYATLKLRLNADLCKDNGECTLFLMTFSYESVPA